MSEPQQRGTQRPSGSGQRRAQTPAASTRAATPAAPTRATSAAPTRAPTPDVRFTLPEFVWPTLPNTTVLYDTHILEHYTHWPTAWGEPERLAYRHLIQEASNQTTYNLWTQFKAYIAEVDRG